MKMCTGNGFHPEVIKYKGSWCPLCTMALLVQNMEKKIFILEKCLKHHEVVKPSRRRLYEEVEILSNYLNNQKEI